MKKLRIGGGTVNQTPLDWLGNTQHIIDAISAAEQEGVRVLCLPELCITGYGCEDLFLSDWLAARAWQQLQIVRRQVKDMVVSVGLPVRIDGITYNGAAVLHKGEILGITLKQNLARDGVHYEPRWFDPWLPFQRRVVDIDNTAVQVGDIIYEVFGISIGFEICEDSWRVNRPGYRLADRGIDLILNPSASHFAMGKSELRESVVVKDGSRKFNCAYVFANLLGNEAGRMIYDGDIVIAQHGNLLAVNRRLSFRSFNVLHADIDFDDATNSSPYISHDQKERNEELARALALGLYDYLRKSKARGFALSLSGGADSASCAVFVAEMVRRASDELGWSAFCESLGLDETAVARDSRNAVGQLLTCAYQSTRNSSETTFNAAQALASSLGAQFHAWSVDDEVASYTKKIETALGRTLTWEVDDIALQNIQARARSPIIWMLANLKRAVLLTTSNRSEGDVGYATMDGDTSGSLAPIAGLSKTFILQWLKWAELKLGHAGLTAINNLQPTAELRPLERTQTDETDLMPYPVLVQIETLGILQRKSPLEVYHTMSDAFPDKAVLRKHINKFFRLWAANQWKRERLAPSFHLDDLNVDPRTWCRFPILSAGFSEELVQLDRES